MYAQGAQPTYEAYGTAKRVADFDSRHRSCIVTFLTFRTPVPIGEPSYLYVYYCVFSYEYNVLLATTVLLTLISLFYCERRSVSHDHANWWVTSSVFTIVDVCLRRSTYLLSIRNRKACRIFRMTSSIRHSNILNVSHTRTNR